MPFQVVFHVTQIPAGQITYFSAGEDQYAICNNSIILQAIIVGDATGHQFEWEGPISGTPLGVDVTTDNTFSVSRVPDTPYGGWSGDTLYYYNHADSTDPQYVSGAAYDDKTWRFWIDRGRSTERFDDVVVYGTPTSQLSSGAPEPIDRTPRCSYTDPSRSTSVFSRRPTLKILTGWGTPPDDGVDNNQTFDFVRLEWSEPSLSKYITQYEIQKRNRIIDPWQTVAIIPKNGRREYTLVEQGYVYRIVTRTKEINTSESAIISNEVYASPSRKATIDDKYYSMSSPLSSPFRTGSEQSTVINSYNVIQRTLTTLALPFDTLTSSSRTQSFSRIGSYNVIERTLSKCGYPDNFPADELSSSFAVGQYSRITNYSVLDLGGGSIGG